MRFPVQLTDSNGNPGRCCVAFLCVLVCGVMLVSSSHGVSVVEGQDEDEDNYADAD